jgi:hypothetical protein
VEKATVVKIFDICRRFEEMMNQEKAPAMPLWVKVLGLLVLLLMVGIIGAHLMGMGGADMHTMHSPSIEVTEQP